MSEATETGIGLVKGANISLRQVAAELGSISAILEWETAPDDLVDADVSVLLLGADGRVRSNDDLIFYNHPSGAEGAVQLRGKVESPDAGNKVTTDAVTIDLDELPDSVSRVLLVASLDCGDRGFGSLKGVRIRLLRASDAHQLLHFDITDASSEKALLFGEFYRRNEDWKFRAIGQGYESGLAGLAADFGIEVQEDSRSDQSEATEAAESLQSEESGETAQPTQDVQRSGRVVVGKALVSPPKMPAGRRRQRLAPTSGEPDWQPSRLFPISGIGGGEEQERRATSALLAVMATVREFGRAITQRLEGPAGHVETFIEVPFGLGENTYQPDGVIRVTRGQRSWTALVEVKTSDNELRMDQIECYVEIARQRGFDAVVSISNQIAEQLGGHPFAVDKRKLKKVQLHHLSWDEIRTEALLVSEHRGVADKTQAHVLREFVRYLEHPRSGAQGFNDMGPHWVRVREAARAGTLRGTDKGALHIASRFEQLHRYAAMHLASLLGVEVSASTNGRTAGQDRLPIVIDDMVTLGRATGVLRVPGTVGAIGTVIDLRAERVSCNVSTDAPKTGRPMTRVNWLLRQLKEAPDSVLVEALLSGPKGESTAALMGSLRKKPEQLVPAQAKDIKAFRLSLSAPMGSKRGVGKGSLITSVIDLLETFYGDVVQELRAWTPRPPTLQPQEQER